MKIVKLSFQNGLQFKSFVRDVLEIAGLTNHYHFVEDNHSPDILIFGPYGYSSPPKGTYKRVAYICENYTPDLSMAEWTFGVPSENEINDKRYKRIQWHGIHPSQLIKSADFNAESVLSIKTKLCNYFYSNPVVYREKLFKYLSLKIKIDSPGKSMNNMPPIDQHFKENWIQNKRQFLSAYRFTLSLENYAYRGYQTEKIYDPMISNTVPIYIGDPNISKVFNVYSFINAFDLLTYRQKEKWIGIDKHFQWTIGEIFNRRGISSKVLLKVKQYFQQKKMNYFVKHMHQPILEQIHFFEYSNEAYLKLLNQPWLKQNQFDHSLLNLDRWVEIIES